LKIVNSNNIPVKKPKTRLTFSQIRNSWIVQGLLLIAVFAAGMLAYRVGVFRPVYTEIKHFLNDGWSGVTLGGPVEEIYKNVTDEMRLYQNNGLPTLYLDMPFESYQQLLEKRDEAVRLGILITSDEDYVPATVQLGDGNKLDAEVRLKGDWTDHLQGDKWSFRIELKEDGEILHTRKFSIQAPETREYLREWAFHENLMKEGVLTTRYDFVNVLLNGKLLGVYAFEENFATELMESQGRRQGVIIRFDEDLFWDNTANFWSVGQTGKGTFMTTDELSANITPFSASKIAQDPVLSAEAQTATDLLRAYQMGERPASEVFDLPLMGRFFALSDLWSACHGAFWHNMRFYYNPISGLLEPVGYDNEPFQWCDQGHTIVSSFIQKSLFNDPDIRAAYVSELARIADEEYVEAFKAEFEKKHNELSSALKIEYPGEEVGVPWDKLTGRATNLHQEIRPAAAIRGAYSLIGFDSESTNVHSINLDLINLMIVPVEITRLEIDDKPVLTDQLPILLPMVMNPDDAKYIPVQVSIPLDSVETIDPENIKVTVFTRLVGMTEESPISLAGLRLPDPLEIGPTPNQPTKQEVLNQHEFLTNPNDDARMLVVSPGNWMVHGDLILPANADLIIPPGTTLNFEPGAILYATGSVHLKGVASQPVILTAQDKEVGWGGMVVLNSPDPSNWNYAIIERTAGIERGGWILTGGITFFQSDINLDHVFIGNNMTEDAINVVHGKFSFTNSEFAYTFADAFDSDFSTGIIENCNFHDITGDAVDVSGTTATVKNTIFEHIIDKGVSVGEKSDVTIQAAIMNDVNIGVASKDLSKTLVLETKMNDVHFAGLAAYIKKPVYGPASIEAPDIEFTNTVTKTLVQTGSTILLYGEPVNTIDMNVDQLYQEHILGN